MSAQMAPAPGVLDPERQTGGAAHRKGQPDRQVGQTARCTPSQ